MHVNSWVSNYLGFGLINESVVVGYRQLVEAAGPFSGLTVHLLEDTLQGVDIDRTVLTLRREAFGQFTLKDIHYTNRGESNFFPTNFY